MSNQHEYLNNGDYEKYLRNLPAAVLDYFYKEELFFKDNVKPGTTILDVGCGEARTTVPLAVHIGPQGKLIGIDFNRKMYDLAKSKTSVLKNVKLYHLDARKLEKLPQSFDTIMLPYTFLSLLQKQDQAIVLEKAREKLKPKGQVLATLYSEYALPLQMTIYQSLWKPHTLRADANYAYVDAVNYSCERFSKNKIKNLFAKAGL